MAEGTTYRTTDPKTGRSEVLEQPGEPRNLPNRESNGAPDNGMPKPPHTPYEHDGMYRGGKGG